MKLIKIGVPKIDIALPNDLDNPEALAQIPEQEPTPRRTVVRPDPVVAEVATIAATPKRFYFGAPVESISVSQFDPNAKQIKEERKKSEREAKQLAKMAEKESKQPKKRGRPRAPLDCAKFYKLECKYASKDTIVSDSDGSIIVQSELYDPETGVSIAKSYFEDGEMKYTWL